MKCIEFCHKHHCAHADAVEIYPGIHVEYLDCACEAKEFHHDAVDHIMEINHCHYGRVGWDFNDKTSIYMGEGDVTLHSTVLCANSSMHFPLGSYQGMTITIDFKELQTDMPDILQDADIDLNAIQQKFCNSSYSVTIPAGGELDHICNGLYHIPDHLKMAYWKIRTMELLLYLSQQTSTVTPTSTYNSEVIASIRDIQQFLTEHLDQRFTIQELSSRSLINTSTLKDAFKAVYGMPIASYMKEYRIRHAAKLLKHTELPVAEIASLVGYETSSKFTKAFKEILGILPSEYRKET